MTKIKNMTSRLTQAGIASVAMAAVAVLAAPAGHAGAVVGVDVQNYIVMYEGGSASAQLSINNFGTPGNGRVWTGDLGIAGVGQLAATGPGTLNGNINFAAPNTNQSSISNTTVLGTVNFNVASVRDCACNFS